MASQRKQYNKHSQVKQKTGKTFRRNNYDEGYGDSQIESVSKKQIISEKQRRFKQNFKRMIDNGDYDELEEFYD